MSDPQNSEQPKKKLRNKFRKSIDENSTYRIFDPQNPEVPHLEKKNK